jgi:hypothetical protein
VPLGGCRLREVVRFYPTVVAFGLAARTIRMD